MIKPPHSVEAEQQLLGAILMKPDLLPKVIAAGGESLFFDGVHAAILRMAVTKDQAGEQVSPVTLRGWAEGHDGVRSLGGAQYLVRLAGHAVSEHSVDAYCATLADMNDKRRLLTAMDAASADIVKGEDSAGAIAGRLEAALVAQDMGSGPKPVSMMAAVTKAVEQSFAANKGEGGDCVQTGLLSVDRLLGGFYPGEMTLLGGRPSMGKTAVALSIALNAARAGQGVVICSLEMNPEAMALRALSEATGQAGRAITYADMRRGQFSPQQAEHIAAAAREVSELPITFLSREYSDLGSLYAGARQAKRTLGNNMKLLVVDYAQLLRSQAKSRYEQITEISIALKALAGSLNVPVLALSQLSRALEQRDDKRPMMSDLRESGQLEQDADAVLFCYRDEYYIQREEPDIRDGEAHEKWRDAMKHARHRLEIIIAKQRQGEIGTAHVFCNPALNRIWEN